jgi:hypothetical protein
MENNDNDCNNFNDEYTGGSPQHSQLQHSQPSPQSQSQSQSQPQYKKRNIRRNETHLDESLNDEYTASLHSSSPGIGSSILNMSKADQLVPDVQTLTLDDINTSLKVIGDLKEGNKLIIVNGRHLAEDNSYINALSRYNTSQGRKRIITFLENMYSEVIRNVYILLGEIRNKVNVDNNIYMLQGLIYKISVFLHNYEKMRVVYKSDSHTYSQLGLTRDKFFMFLNTFFRDVTTYSVK